MIRLRCQCGKLLKLAMEQAGKLAACPNCRKNVRVVMAKIATQPSPLDTMLIVQAGPQRKGELLFPAGVDAIQVGKGADAHVRLVGASVSRLHCRLVPGQYGWRIEDAGSTNGLFVNGRRVKGHNLLDGDVVRIGDFELRYASQRFRRPVTIEESPESTAAVVEHNQDELRLLDDAAALEQTAADGLGNDDRDDDFLKIAEGDLAKGEAATAGTGTIGPSGVRACPRCGHDLKPDAQICVYCGIDLRTGKRLMAGHSHAEAVSLDSGGGLGPYFRDCLSSFALIVDPGGLFRFIGLAAMMLLQIPCALVGCFGMLGRVIIVGLFGSYLFATVRHTSGGEKDLPEFSMAGGWVEAVVAPIFKFVGTGVLVMIPAIAYVLASAAGGNTKSLPDPDAPLIALLALGAFLWPMSVLITAIGGLGCFLRPDLIALTIFRSFPAYLVACSVTAIAFGVSYGAEYAAGTSTALFGGNPWATAAALSIVDTYFWIVAMMCIGLFYHHFKSRFAWSWG